MRRSLVTVAALFLASLAFEARAQQPAATSNDAVAAAAFEEGTAAFGAGDFVRAADAFERAYAAVPHHDALWNAARARERAGADVLAANLYVRYLREAPANARDRDTAIAALKTLGRKLARIELHIAESVTRARLDGGPFDLIEVWVSPGEHVFEGESTAGPFKKRVQAEAGSVLSVTLEPDPVVPRGTDGGVVEPPKKSFPWIVLVAGGAATLALGGLTTWSALATVDQKKAFNENKTQENLDEGRSRMVRTNILLGVTSGVLVLTGVVTAVLYLAGNDTSPSPKRDVTVGVGPGSVQLEGRF